jgi:1-acyl-sn-glycerol-3-phosphate acyltransferase
MVGLFPQGTRHAKEDPRETTIKNGIGQIVYRSQTTVLPVCIQTKGWKIGFFKRTHVRIGKPMVYADFNFTEGNHAEYDRAAHMVFDKITDMIE